MTDMTDEEAIELANSMQQNMRTGFSSKRVRVYNALSRVLDLARQAQWRPIEELGDVKNGSFVLVFGFAAPSTEN